MNPIDLTPPIQSPTPPAREPFWDYTDIFVFLLSVAASLVIAMLVGVFVLAKVSTSLRLLVPQIVWYALSFASLKLLFWIRYNQPFWRSLGWRPVAFSAF